MSATAWKVDGNRSMLSARASIKLLASPPGGKHSGTGGQQTQDRTMAGLHFNMLLESEGIAPREVRLLRHQQTVVPGRTSYLLWRDERDAFEQWQSCQLAGRASSITIARTIA